MVRHLNVSQQKLAEKLTILNDRGIGMLTRLYNIKKQSSDPKLRPPILSDKGLESAMKQIVRRFPHTDTRSNNVNINSFQSIFFASFILIFSSFFFFKEFDWSCSYCSY
uniref:Uncharacterized protein n=1 Tax=Tetranychus urticae TaxID=32264 RepID=T1JZB3_TETUR